MATRATIPLATRIPKDLAGALNDSCELLGMRKTHVIEAALREWLEDALDAHDLREARRDATGYRPWESVKEAWQAQRAGKKRPMRVAEDPDGGDPYSIHRGDNSLGLRKDLRAYAVRFEKLLRDWNRLSRDLPVVSRVLRDLRENAVPTAHSKGGSSRRVRS